jgi:hypothetical protein
MNLNREDEYLDEQAREAWSAMGHAFSEAGRALHPRHWSARARWVALGATALAGFVVGAAPGSRPSDEAAPLRGGQAPEASTKHHRIGAIFKLVLELAAIARPLLQSAFAGLMAHASHDGAGEPHEASEPPSRPA